MMRWSYFGGLHVNASFGTDFSGLNSGVVLIPVWSWGDSPHHHYADDSQLYVSFASGDSAAALNGLQSRLASLQSWMSTNKLKLNLDKTEFLLIGNERQRSKYLSVFPVELLGVKTNPAKSARNLDVIFDKNFTFHSHSSAVCRSCLYHKRDLRRIRRHLDLDGANLLATALVSSRLDYCNSRLYSIADIDPTRLTRVQNQLACLVTKSPPFTCSISLLRSLHWLPVRFRILFKINVLTYKTLREKQPVFRHSMLATSVPSRSLRSNNNSLSVPRVKTNTGARAFHSCAPSLWNNVPLSVHSASSVATFKKYLKTHLSDLALP